MRPAAARGSKLRAHAGTRMRHTGNPGCGTRHHRYATQSGAKGRDIGKGGFTPRAAFQRQRIKRIWQGAVACRLRRADQKIALPIKT